MDQPQIFSATLGLFAPWRITAITFSERENRIDITVDAHEGEPVSCPECGTRATTGNVLHETWQHLDFFCHTAYVHVRIPCISCPCCEHALTLPVPWAREGSDFVRLDSPPETSTTLQ